MKEKLNISFKFNSVKNWFDNNYFLCLYDRQDNFITSFDCMQDCSNYLGKSIGWIIDNLRRGFAIVYNHKKYKLICIEKDNEDELDFEERGKCL